MPNWCSNDLFIYGKDLQAIADKVRAEVDGKVSLFTFDNILPMPEVLRDTQAGSDAWLGGGRVTGENGWPHSAPDYKNARTPTEFLALVKEKHPQAIKEGEKSLAALKETGCKDWYDWSVKHWGTKWDVSDAALIDEPRRKVKRLRYYFDMAWSPPIPVIQKLSEMFPKNRMTLRFYERGAAYKGVRIFKAGEALSQSDGTYKGDRGG